MSTRFAGKVAIVTGGGAGIGAAIATRLATEGARVVVMDLDGDAAETVARSIGGVAARGNAAELDDVRSAVTRALELGAGLDVVIANAGVHRPGALGEIHPDDWRAALDGNLTTAFATARGTLAALADGGGALVVVSSVAALAAGPGMVGYTSAKTGLLGLVRSLAVDYGPHGVRVTALCPGWVRTPMSEREMDELAERKGIGREAAYGRVTRLIPLRSVAAPEDIAAAACFLASPDAAFVSGTALVVDGGLSAVSVGMLAFASDEPPELDAR